MSYKIGDIVMKCKSFTYVVHEDAFTSENTHCSKGLLAQCLELLATFDLKLIYIIYGLIC